MRLAALHVFRDARDPFPPEDRRSSSPAIEALYLRNAKRLLGFFARRVGREDAADLVHDTFARFAGMEAATRARVNEQDAYLSTVATNLLKDRARAAARRAAHRLGEGALEPPDIVDPHAMFEERDTLRRLEQAVDQLPSRRRRIFLLHRLENLTYAEIARDVGLSEKGVKKQMAKALFELRRAMGSL